MWDRDLQEQFLCTRKLPTTTTAEDIFSYVDLYLSSMGLSCDICVCITTDSAASMTQKNLGVMRILEKAPNATWNYCFSHRKALAAKDMVLVLHGTLKDVIQVVNYLKRSAKNTWCFQKLYQDLVSEHVPMLYHAEVCWLSRGKVLFRFYEPRAVITAFLAQNNSPLAHLFSNSVWHLESTWKASVYQAMKSVN